MKQGISYKILASRKNYLRFACTIQNECLSLQCLKNDSRLSRRASVIAQRFRLGVFYAHKDIGGCHSVEFSKPFG
nr:MAG TPA: hypothetical protein [Caudoviricetes sp.]